MRSGSMIGFLLKSAVFSALVMLGAQASGAVKYEAVKRTIDGDTFELASGERVRLIGVQAPERGKCYAQQATTTLDGAIRPDGVHVIRKGKDKYGRTLAYVYVNPEKPLPSFRLSRNSVNLYMIINGYAKSYRRFPHKYASSYNKAEKWARGQCQGLWQLCEIALPKSNCGLR